MKHKYLLPLALLIACAHPSATDYFNLGNKETASTDNLRAIADYTRAIKIDHRYVEAYWSRAMAEHAIDSLDSEIRDYDTLLSWAPKQEEMGNLYYLRGNAEYLLSRDSAACGDWRRAKDLNCLAAWERVRKNCK